MAKMIFKTNDHMEFAVDIEAIKCSTTIATMLNDLGEEGLDESIVLYNVDGKIFDIIVRWAIEHKGEPPLPDQDEVLPRTTPSLSEWDQNLLKDLDMETFIELANAANYLEIKTLIEICCIHLANLIKDMTFEGIRKIMNAKPVDQENEQFVENVADAEVVLPVQQNE